MQSIPRIGGPGGQRGERLRQLDGTMPRLNEIPPGCPFNPRCPETFERGRHERPDLLPALGSEAACWLYDRPKIRSPGASRDPLLNDLERGPVGPGLRRD